MCMDYRQQKGLVKTLQTRLGQVCKWARGGDGGNTGVTAGQEGVAGSEMARELMYGKGR